jgi:hypothetical protein
MVRLPILLLVVAFGPALSAQTFLTVDQFEKSLPTLRAESDSRAARDLAAVKLTERASPERAAHWKSEMPGKNSAEALTALADASAFLDLPAEETPATRTPAIDAQKQILLRAVDSVETMLHKLPDFYAVRTTTHYETATPQQLDAQTQSISLLQLEQGGLRPHGPVRIPHHELGQVTPGKPGASRLFFLADEVQSVTYRDGEEVEGAPSGGGLPGLAFAPTTRGEFGPILNVVLEDAPQRGLRWSHWETGASGPVAVFQYEVPRDHSHFELDNVKGGAPDFPAYHGELAIDPATGTILRIMIQVSTSQQTYESLDSDILVEYAPVDIGGKTYDCPVHGVVVTTRRRADAPKDAPVLDARPIFLNDVTFTGYHVFRSEMRILPAGH